MGARRGCEAAEVVATFERGDEPAAGVAFGDPAHDPSHLGEVGVGEREPAEGIADPRVESGRHQDQLRAEGVGRGQEPVAVGPEDLAPPRSGLPPWRLRFLRRRSE